MLRFVVCFSIFIIGHTVDLSATKRRLIAQVCGVSIAPNDVCQLSLETYSKKMDVLVEDFANTTVIEQKQSTLLVSLIRLYLQSSTEDSCNATADPTTVSVFYRSLLLMESSVFYDFEAHRIIGDILELMKSIKALVPDQQNEFVQLLKCANTTLAKFKAVDPSTIIPNILTLSELLLLSTKTKAA